MHLLLPLDLATAELAVESLTLIIAGTVAARHLSFVDTDRNIARSQSDRVRRSVSA
jgi:hypothetical protein